MKLYYTKRSPYARKCRVVALEKNMKLELIEVDLASKPAELIAANPLGKIPTLITDSGNALFDSVVIAEYLNALTPYPVLIPPLSDASERFKVLTVSAAGDGLAEAAITIVYENMRPENIRYEGTYTKENARMKSLFAYLESEILTLQSSTNIASISVATSLSYIDFRLPDTNWREACPKLALWHKEFEQRSSMMETKISA
jgi:glutathione S-transferase